MDASIFEPCRDSAAAAETRRGIVNAILDISLEADVTAVREIVELRVAASGKTHDGIHYKEVLRQLSEDKRYRHLFKRTPEPKKDEELS